MNDDMPWVDLTPEEIQELRTKKHELTEYGKQKLRKLMTHEEMLEEAEKREIENQVNSTDDYFKKMEESLQSKSIQTVIKDIDEYSDALSKSKSVKKILDLTSKLRENFTFLGEKCLENYEKEYDKMPEYEQWIFMESMRFSPGEGHKTCLLMTQGIPCAEDYENDQLVTTQAHRAVREFHREFGTSSLHNLNFHPRDVFFEKYFKQSYGITSKLKTTPCMLTFKTELSYSFP